MTLTPDELESLTLHRRSDAQRRELLAMGIPFRIRRDGSLAVSRAAAELALGGRLPATIREPEVQP